jgi:hypothetical protein
MGHKQYRLPSGEFVDTVVMLDPVTGLPTSGGGGGGGTGQTNSESITQFGTQADAQAGATGDSSLFGFLKFGRAQWQNLLSLLPGSLGAKTKSNSFSVTPATDATFEVASVDLGAQADAAGAAAGTGNASLFGWLKRGALNFASLLTEIASIKSILQAQRSDTLWTDNTNAYFVRSVVNGAVTWSTPAGGVSAAPGAGSRPADATNVVVATTLFRATIAGTGYSIGDYLSQLVTTDQDDGTVIGSFWINTTTTLKLASPPLAANIAPVITNDAATAANQLLQTTQLTNSNTNLGAQADVAAVAAGTGNYSIISALKRGLLNWATFFTLLPASIGQKLMAGSLSVTVASDQSALTGLNDGPVAPGAAATRSGLAGGIFNTAPPTFTNGQQGSLQLDAAGNLKTLGMPLVQVASGAITTQNLVSGGVATAGSAVEIVLQGLGSLNIQTVGTYTGALSLQTTVDGTNWVTMGGLPLMNDNTGTALATITSALQSIFSADVAGNARARITALAAVTGSVTVSLNATTGTELVAIDAALPAGANSIGNIGTVAGVTTVSTVTASNLAANGAVTDVASAVLATAGLTNSATITPTSGASYVVTIPVTAFSGTSPTMDVIVQESDDAGTNWRNVYTFPTITGNGSFSSPQLELTGNRIRYAQTLGGTTPSFTRAIARSTRSGSAALERGIGSHNNSTITLGGAAQTVLALNTSRKSIEIQNLSAADLWIRFNGVAGVNAGFKVTAGNGWSNPASACPVGLFSVFGATTGQAFSVKPLALAAQALALSRFVRHRRAMPCSHRL